MIHVAIKMEVKGEFPGGLVFRILSFHCHAPGSIPAGGTEILQAAPKKKKKKQVKASGLVRKPQSAC